MSDRQSTVSGSSVQRSVSISEPEQTFVKRRENDDREYSRLSPNISKFNY